MTYAYKETFKGRKFYIEAPVFDLEEIAHSLSMMCRFGGHCKRFYSVAEHSVLVADIMDTLLLGDSREGLLHDGVESMLPDVVSPIKVQLPDYKALDKRLDAALRKQFALPETITDGCKHADWIALCLEANTLMHTGGVDWHFPPGVRTDASAYWARKSGYRIAAGYAPDIARLDFLDACKTRSLQW